MTIPATDNGGPAFPFEFHNQTSSMQDGFFGTSPLKPGASQQFAGMTLRDWLAGMALQGYIAANPEFKVNAKDAAFESYKYADAMLQERSK